MSNISVNTVSREPTHFLAAVELIKEARKSYQIPSENWPYPLSYRYGFPEDRYYAEVWVDGMDWQYTYWIIEKANYNNPIVYPLVVFDSHKQRDLFNDYDLRQLFMAMMDYRRNEIWLRSSEDSWYNDDVWCFVERLFPIQEERLKKWGCDRFVLEHASQKPVTFFGNLAYIPERCKTPNRAFTDMTKLFRIVCSHPYIVELFLTKRKKHNVIEAHGSVAPIVNYVGFQCKKTGSIWVISADDIERNHSAVAEDLFRASEHGDKESEEKILSFVNKNVME
jgi:hypothetical protein